MLNLSRPDWQERIRAGKSLLPDVAPVDADLAARAVAYFDALRIPDVLGTPLLRDACGDWFRDIVAMLFGSLDPETKTRLIREVFLLVPKKNGKTTMGAALMLVAVLLNERPNAEFLIVAPTKDIAGLAFRQAAGMVNLNRNLRKRFKLQPHIKTLTYLPTGATLCVKAFDANVMTGVKPAGVLVDEEHQIAIKPEAEDVMIQIRGGMISQEEAFLITITTQSVKPPRGVFRDDLLQARAIRDGESYRKGDDDQLIPVANDVLPVLYEFPEDIQKAATLPGQAAPWENPSLWHMVLPNLGRSFKLERLVEEFEKSRAKGIQDLTKWASQHLNVEIGLALRNDRWAGADYWEEQADPDLTLDEIISRSDVLVGGIDGGGLDDLMSLSVLGRDSVTDQWLHWQKSWVMQCVLDIRKKEASQLEDFAKQGDLVLVEEPGLDVEGIADALGYVNKSGKLAMVGLDPQGVGLVVDALADRGISGSRVVGVAQGWTLSGAIKTTERKLADRTLLHAGQPIMAWAVSNAKAEARGNAVIITKQGSGYLKIDPLMSLLNAVTLMSKNPQAKPTMDSFMRRGLLSV